MSCSYGDKIKIQIFGQSHSDSLGVVIDGVPVGIKLDMDSIQNFLKRRQGGNVKISTPRKEADEPRIISGVVDGITCGAPLCAVFENSNTRSSDYKKDVVRPSHADYNAYVKYNGFNDYRGGGHFSGRMTLCLCFAGAICKQILKEKNIEIIAHIKSIGKIEDDGFDMVNIQNVLTDFPVINKIIGEQMIETINTVRQKGDSIGGTIECAIKNVPIGIGEPMFDGIENEISKVIFAIPGVKGIEFGSGFNCATMLGSEHNDEYYYKDDKVLTKTNNSGGIIGGISSGMPIILRAAFKPTPSILIEQNTVNIINKTNTKLKTQGRHDPCIVVRAVPVVEAACAIALVNLL